MIFFLYTTESKLQANLHPCSTRWRQRWARAGNLLLLPAPANPSLAKTLWALGEGVPHVSSSLPTDIFLHSSGDNPSVQKFRSSPLSDGRSTNFASPRKCCTEGKGTQAPKCSSSPPEVRQQLWLFQNTAEPKSLALDGCCRHRVCHKPPSFQIPGIQF